MWLKTTSDVYALATSNHFSSASNVQPYCKGGWENVDEHVDISGYQFLTHGTTFYLFVRLICLGPIFTYTKHR